MQRPAEGCAVIGTQALQTKNCFCTASLHFAHNLLVSVAALPLRWGEVVQSVAYRNGMHSAGGGFTPAQDGLGRPLGSGVAFTAAQAANDY